MRCVLSGYFGRYLAAPPADEQCLCLRRCFLFDKDDEIYGQLLLNDRAEICATHPDQSTICISCKLREDKGEEPRRAMLRSCEESLDGIRKDGRYTVFRLASGNAVITDFTGKTEEIEL